MKHLLTYKLFESVQSYDWSFDELNGVYYFKDEFNNQFRVEIDRHPENEVEIRYLTKDGDKWTFKEVKTNIFRVTETVMGQILKDFLSRNDWVQSVKIVGLGKTTEKEAITQRTKLYWRYLSNNPMDGWELDKYGNEIYLDKI
jgi:hypothetical protein